jgi:FkbM family methyltransferase
MKKIIRIIKESLFALAAYRNFWAYFRERLGRSKTPTVLIRLRNGTSYHIESGNNQLWVIDEIWHLKVYDPLLAYIKEGSTVIDIGANIGIFSIKAAKTAKNVRVISYEPFPGNMVLLKKNIAANNVGKNVTAIHEAVAGTRDPLELFFRPLDSGGVSMYRHGEYQEELSSIKVPSVTLQDVFTGNAIERCDYLKMDCEGAEEQILLQAPKELFQRIRSMTIEWHYDLNKMSEEEFNSFLVSLGYKTRYVKETLTMYAWRT